MRVARCSRATLLAVAVASATLLVACSGSTSSSSAPRTHTREIYASHSVTCTADQRVERLPGPYLFGCVTASPAQPVPRVPDVQQGDPCPVFGATTYNPQGAAFDCEPWGPNPTELRWIVP